MEKTPTPALERGLQILELIHQGDEKSLSELAKESGFPKSSVSRYIDTLVQAGYVERIHETQKFRSGCSIIRTHTKSDFIIEQLPQAMKSMVEETGFTAEWYELENGQAVVKLIHEPENVSVKVVTKYNFARQLNRELDVIARLFLANIGKPSPMPNYYIRHWEEKQPLSNTDAAKLIEEVNNETVVVDKYFNQNGVRRCALAVKDENGDFLGVLALAGHYHPASNKVLKKGVDLLMKYSEVLSK